MDARGNKAEVDAQFTPPVERLAFSIIGKLEKNFAEICAEPLAIVIHALCSLISANTVKEEAQTLSGWTHEQVLEGLRNLDEEDDLYHLDIFQENEEYLLQQFDQLVAFYKAAADKGLGALHYPI